MPESRVEALRSNDDAVRACSELNVQQLLSTGENGLRSLYENWCRNSLDSDVGIARGLARKWLETGRFKRRHPHEFLMLVDMLGFSAGSVYECGGADPLANVKKVEERGMGIQKDVVDLANFRLHKIFCALALYADAYRQKCLKKGDVLVASPLRGCAKCERVDSKEGRELQGCRGCVEKTSVMFCGKECQRAFFPSLVSDCAQLKSDKAKGSAHSCQVCGAEKSEDGKKLRTCSGCTNKCARYCSKDCQKVAWQAGHKRECKVS